MDADSAILNVHEVHLDRINEELKEVLSSRVPIIENIGRHILLGHGKRLRPLLFVFSSYLCNYQGEDVYRLSTVFEYIHSASLLHDDVLDNAEVRRNRPSANHLWGNHAAVLEGDFLYSKSSSIAVATNNLLFLERLTDTTTQMTEGQILEMIHTDDWNISKAEYMEIITAKTAVLMSAACACGGIISGAKVEFEQALAEFGLNVGVAFQLMDDLLDYTSSEDVFGKPVGKDLKEGKITLPLIYAMSEFEENETRRLEDLFVNQKATDGDYLSLIELVRAKGVIDRIREEAQSYVDKAIGCLNPFPDSLNKRNLLGLSQYVIERKC